MSQATLPMSNDDPRAISDAPSTTRRCELEQFLPYRLNVVAALVSQALSRIYAERYDIGVPEWRVLVDARPIRRDDRQGDRRARHMHKTKVSRAVALLERRKLLARRANRADMREAFLSLTPAGRAIYEDLAPVALEFAHRLLEAIDPADRAAFDRALTADRTLAELPRSRKLQPSG